MPRAGPVAIGLGVFALSLAIRCLYAVDLAPVMYTRDQPGTRMAMRYDDAALRMLAGDGLLYPVEIDPARTGLLARPPGYSAFLRVVYASLGRSFFTAQVVQNLLNAVTPVLILLLGTRLLGPAVGAVGGLFAALSPHLGYASNLLSPDALSALPLAGASLLLACSRLEKGPSLGSAAMAGVLVGISAWLRPNVVLMGPFLGAALVLLARDRRAALRPAVVLAAAAGLTILPITLRNYVVFGELVPISTNGGLTLWQGVADAGGERFGARTTDRRVAREEAARYGKPEYAQWWAEPDGIWRDHDRYRRSLEVIEQRPLWYLRAMLRRMAAMVSYHSAEAPFVARVAGIERLTPIVDDEEGAQEGDLLAPLRTFERSAASARPPRIPDSVILAPGELLASFRPLVRGIQAVAAAMTLPLAIVGIVALSRRAPRAAGFVAIVPVYYLIFESMFIYEWRVATPMHGYLFLFAAAGGVSLFDLARRRVRPSA
jgi:Dolichyl-phosphate-mannose-protein mannosyltransferase